MINRKTNDCVCRCCRGVVHPIFDGMLLELNIAYYECPNCGYVQTEIPYWLDQAYSAAINDSDTGIMSRNQTNARIMLATLMLLGKLNGTLVDCAGMRVRK